MNYYELLGVSRDATEAEIKKAYRALVKEVHPDSGNPGDVERFREIRKAYETLSDPDKRRAHDSTPTRPVSWTGGFDEPLAPFREVGARRRREPPVHLDIVLTMEEAETGGDVVLEAPHDADCPACAGRGLGFFGWCGTCRGEGWLRVRERYVFRIPPGARHGEVVTATDGRLRGQIRVRRIPAS